MKDSDTLLELYTAGVIDRLGKDTTTSTSELLDYGRNATTEQRQRPCHSLATTWQRPGKDNSATAEDLHDSSG